ncbi:MAG: hypothetical protein ACNS63_03400 [Candidatus Nitrospinota bacterium M3_3B_026]
MRYEPDGPKPALGAALSGLAAAGLFGLASLYPLIFGARDWFYSTLTAHLALMSHVWIPAAEITIWNMAGRIAGTRVKSYRWTGPVAAGGGVLILAGTVAGWDRPAPVDYAPAFGSPLFTAGMAAVYAAWLAASLTPFRAWAALGKDPDGAAPPIILAGMMAASAAAWATAVNALLAWLATPGSLAGASSLGTVAYGPGHSIQFTHVTLMTCAWIMLSGFRDEGLKRTALALLYAAAACAAMATPLIYIFEDPVSQTLKMTWTLVLGGGLGTTSFLAAVVIFAGRGRPSGALALVAVAMVSFVAGGLLPSLDDRESMALTGHYHGLLIAVSASFLGLLTGRKAKTTVPAALFGLGGLLMALSFLWLAGTRLLRKTVSVDGLWADHPAGTLALLFASSAAAAGAAWQMVSYLRGSRS